MMKGWLHSLREKQEGYLSLEACIVVPLFLFFVLTMYGLITVFMAQNIIGHVLVESAQSLALDAYATNKLSQPNGLIDLGINLVMELTDLDADDPSFSNSERWYDRKHGATQEDWVEAVEARFLGYLAGRADSETLEDTKSRADDILQALRVTGGVSGLDFSESDLRGSDLYVKVTYNIEFFFNPFGLAEFSTTQQASARMWGASTTGEESSSSGDSSADGPSAGGSSGGGSR